MTDLIFSQIKYDAILETLDDLYLTEIVQERMHEEAIEISIEDL